MSEGSLWYYRDQHGSLVAVDHYDHIPKAFRKTAKQVSVDPVVIEDSDVLRARAEIREAAANLTGSHQWGETINAMPLWVGIGAGAAAFAGALVVWRLSTLRGFSKFLLIAAVTVLPLAAALSVPMLRQRIVGSSPIAAPTLPGGEVDPSLDAIRNEMQNYLETIDRLDAQTDPQ